MTQYTSCPDLDRFVMALSSNAPIAGYVTPPVLEHEVEVIVGLGHNPPKYQFARHGFFHPIVNDLQRPANLVFLDPAEAFAYASKFDQVKTSPISVAELFRMTERASGGSCGVMFRIEGNDHYAHPAVVSDFNHYASLGGLTLLFQNGKSNLVREGELVLDLNQLQDLEILLEESPLVESFSLWLGNVDGIETTVIDIVVPDAMPLAMAAMEHAHLTQGCQKIISNATVLASPARRFREPPLMGR